MRKKEENTFSADILLFVLTNEKAFHLAPTRTESPRTIFPDRPSSVDGRFKGRRNNGPARSTYSTKVESSVRERN